MSFVEIIKDVRSYMRKHSQELQELKEAIVMSNCLKKELLTVEEAAVLMGYEKSYIYKLSHERSIPSYSPTKGGKIYFKRIELVKWMTSYSKKTVDEYQQDISESALKIDS